MITSVSPIVKVEQKEGSAVAERRQREVSPHPSTYFDTILTTDEMIKRAGIKSNCQKDRLERRYARQHRSSIEYEEDHDECYDEDDIKFPLYSYQIDLVDSEMREELMKCAVSVAVACPAAAASAAPVAGIQLGSSVVEMREPVCSLLSVSSSSSSSSASTPSVLVLRRLRSSKSFVGSGKGMSFPRWPRVTPSPVPFELSP